MLYFIKKVENIKAKRKILNICETESDLIENLIKELLKPFLNLSQLNSLNQTSDFKLKAQFAKKNIKVSHEKNSLEKPEKYETRDPNVRFFFILQRLYFPPYIY